MATDQVLHITDASFESDILRSELPSIVDFWATWCGPCRAIAPTLDDLAEKYVDQVKVAKVNVDENPQTPSNYSIMSIPTLLLFKNGEVVDQLMGAVSRSRLEAFFQKALEA